ncbi:TldD/PmbA family protein [Candidatus Atribacteria bacterium 1244-E10-H5-B2]|nr:MAG: TldD/PmbA family protein [Candidatus Atribacteria bacterium 1244-E10-H5-B2]
MEKLLQEACKKVDSAEIFRVKSKTIPVNFEVNKLKSIDISENEGKALRVVNKGRIGFSSSTGNEDFNLMVEKAVATSEFGSEASFDFPGEIKRGGKEKKKVNIYDRKVANKGIEEMIKIGEDIIERMKDFNRKLRCDVTILKDYSEVEYFNSRGGFFSYNKTTIAYSVMVQKIKKQDMLMVYSSLESGKDNLNSEELTSEIIKNLEWGEKIVSIKSGKMPVIFTPKAALVLILPIISGLNGKMVLKKISPLAAQKNKKLWSDLLTIYSDGTINFALGSAPFDDEGVEMKRIPLVKKGEIKNFYYDLQTAGIAGVESTGNGLRTGLQSEPVPSISNLVMREGEISFKEMIKDISEGIVIDQVLGLGQGNIISGAFSNNVQLGYKIEKGKIVGRVKNVMISGNAIEELKNIVALGDKSKWISGKYKFPHIYLKSLSISAKK